MGKVLLIWTYESDMIECPDYISNNIEEYVKNFDLWISDKDSGYWVKDCFDNNAICFGSDAFVDWLNRYAVRKDENNVIFIKRNFQPSAEERQLPHVYF